MANGFSFSQPQFDIQGRRVDPLSSQGIVQPADDQDSLVLGISQQIQGNQDRINRFNQAQTQLRGLDPRNERQRQQIEAGIADIDPIGLQRENDLLIQRRDFLSQQPAPSAQPQPFTEPTVPGVEQRFDQVGVPTVSTDTLEQQIQKQEAAGNIEGANVLRSIQNENGAFAQAQKNLIGQYNIFGQGLNERNERFLNIMQGVDKDYKGLLDQERQFFEQRFGPGGSQERRLNEIYGNLAEFLSRKQAGEQALAQSLATRTGSTPAQAIATANRIAENQMGEVLKVRGEEIDAYNNLNLTYSQMLKDFTERYAGSTDRNIVQTYKEILQKVDATEAQRFEAQRLLDQQELSFNIQRQAAGLGGGGGGGGGTSGGAGGSVGSATAQAGATPEETRANIESALQQQFGVGISDLPEAQRTQIENGIAAGDIDQINSSLSGVGTLFSTGELESRIDPNVSREVADGLRSRAEPLDTVPLDRRFPNGFRIMNNLQPGHREIFDTVFTASQKASFIQDLNQPSGFLSPAGRRWSQILNNERRKLDAQKGIQERRDQKSLEKERDRATQQDLEQFFSN